MPSKNWKKGSTSAWRRIRAQVLLTNQLRNKGLCTLQIPGKCSGLATQVHHTYGREVTGDDIRYLQAVCQPCNGSVGDPTKGPDPRSNPKTRW